MCLKRLSTNLFLGQTLILLVFSVLPFIPSISFPLLEGWDDHVYVTANVDKFTFSFPNIRHWFTTTCEGCFLPLTMISYMFDFSVWGLNAVGYHLQNIFWHLLAILALHRLLLMLGIKSQLAFLCSIFFAVHPQRSESVVWISERKDVLCAAFYLWALLCFMRSEAGDTSHRRNYIFSVIFAFFAFLAKPMAVSLPFIILFFLMIRQGMGIQKKTLMKIIPFFLMALICVPIAIISQDIPQAHLSFMKRLAVVIFNIPFYVLKTFLPFNLSPIYPRVIPSANMLISTTVFYSLAIVGIIFFLLRKKHSEIWARNFLLILSFLVSLAPVSGIVPLGAIDYADRYSYIPSVFLIMFTATLINRFFSEEKAKKYLSIALSVYIAILAIITYFHSYTWQSYRAVLESALSYNPPPYMALGAIADIEFFTGNRSRIPELAKIARGREPGWESEGGVKRIIFKIDILEMRYYHEAGNSVESAKIAKQLLKNDMSEFIVGQNDRDAFIKFLEEIADENALPVRERHQPE